MRAVAAVVAGLMTAALVAPSAASAPVGPFVGAPNVIGSTGSFGSTPPPQLAALPDGTTLAAWVKPAAASFAVRVRPAGSSVWQSAATTPLEAGWTVLPDAGQVNPFLLRPAGESAFLLVWEETNGVFERILAQRLSRTGTPVGAPTILTSPDHPFLLDVATNSVGRASVVFWVDASTMRFSVTTRATESSGWKAPVTLGTLVSGPPPPPEYWGYLSRTAVHDSGTVCAVYPSAWTAASVTLKSRCAAPAAMGSATPQSVGTFAASPTSELLGSAASLSATRSGFLLAGIVASSGDVPWPSLAPFPPTRIQVRARPAGSGTWSTEATLGLTGEANISPTALASATGIAVHFLRVRGAAGTTPIAPAVSVDQRLAQRPGSGAWTPVQTLESFAIDNPGTVSALISGATLGPAGELLVSVPNTNLSGTWTSGFVRRSSWGGGFTNSTGLGESLDVSSVIAASGRATAIGRTYSGTDVVVVQTALPKPFVRSAATITTAPRVGTSATCTFAFTDAASLTRQWRVNGIVRSTASTYTPKATDRGKTLTCRITGTNPTGSTVSLSAGRVVT